MFTTPFDFTLRAHRERLGYTQKTFAKLTGHSESYLSRMETGFSTPLDPLLIDNLAKAFSLSPQEKSALTLATHESQKIIQLPAELSLKGYSVFHRFLKVATQLNEYELAEIEGTCRKHNLHEKPCS